MSRIDKAAKNVKYGYMGIITQLALGFVSRTVFIYILGVTYLGVNSLYANVLGILSFAELGIGTAMNYSLYKPIAENDRETIKALMLLYKRAYRIIAIIISVAGLSLVPFLKYIIKDPGSITVGELQLFFIGILGEYIGAIYTQVKDRPLVIEKERINF